jgi:tetratricopeptide (TPR) repeat protein
LIPVAVLSWAIPRVLSNLGLVAQQRGNLEEALAMFERGNEVAAQLGERASVVHGKMNIGNVLLQQGRLNEALNAYAMAREIADQLTLPLEAAGARNAIAYVLGLQGKIGAALAAFRDAEAHITSPAGFVELAGRLEHLAEVYAANGHNQLASICAYEATRLRDAAEKGSASRCRS